ncbi:MAG: regulator, partial [Clostridiales bacterium]|nr:regulator [Clostridiales bacterium]
MKKIISTDKAPAAIGPYSQAVQAGNIIFISGQIALNPATGELSGSTAPEQAKQVFENIKAVLE